jgi:hypothetical protein
MRLLLEAAKESITAAGAPLVVVVVAVCVSLLAVTAVLTNCGICVDKPEPPAYPEPKDLYDAGAASIYAAPNDRPQGRPGLQPPGSGGQHLTPPAHNAPPYQKHGSGRPYQPQNDSGYHQRPRNHSQMPPKQHYPPQNYPPQHYPPQQHALPPGAFATNVPGGHMHRYTNQAEGRAQSGVPPDVILTSRGPGPTGPDMLNSGTRPSSQPDAGGYPPMNRPPADMASTGSRDSPYFRQASVNDGLGRRPSQASSLAYPSQRGQYDPQENTYETAMSQAETNESFISNAKNGEFLARPGCIAPCVQTDERGLLPCDQGLRVHAMDKWLHLFRSLGEHAQSLQPSRNMITLSGCVHEASCANVRRLYPAGLESHERSPENVRLC